MKMLIKSKPLASIILAIVFMFASVPVNATIPSPPPPIPEPITPIFPEPAEHRRTIQQFTSEIRELQSQVFDIAQFAQVNPVEFEQRLTNNIRYINRRIELLNIRLLEYLEAVAVIGEQNTHVLLVLNSLNFVKNSLYSLSVLTTLTTDVQRIRLLDEYFRARIAGMDTLTTVETLISN